MPLFDGAGRWECPVYKRGDRLLQAPPYKRRATGDAALQNGGVPLRDGAYEVGEGSTVTRSTLPWSAALPDGAPPWGRALGALVLPLPIRFCEVPLIGGSQ